MARFGINDRLSGARQADGGYAMATAALPATAATVTSVDSATTSTSLLAANADRKGATILNTDTNALYVDLSGGTASATAYSVNLAQNASYDVPYGYTGAITGIWAGDGTGAALITEFS